METYEGLPAEDLIECLAGKGKSVNVAQAVGVLARSIRQKPVKLTDSLKPTGLNRKFVQALRFCLAHSDTQVVKDTLCCIQDLFCSRNLQRLFEPSDLCSLLQTIVERFVARPNISLDVRCSALECVAGAKVPGSSANFYTPVLLDGIQRGLEWVVREGNAEDGVFYAAVVKAIGAMLKQLSASSLCRHASTWVLPLLQCFHGPNHRTREKVLCLVDEYREALGQSSAVEREVVAALNDTWAQGIVAVFEGRVGPGPSKRAMQQALRYVEVLVGVAGCELRRNRDALNGVLAILPKALDMIPEVRMYAYSTWVAVGDMLAAEPTKMGDEHMRRLAWGLVKKGLRTEKDLTAMLLLVAMGWGIATLLPGCGEAGGEDNMQARAVELMAYCSQREAKDMHVLRNTMLLRLCGEDSSPGPEALPTGTHVREEQMARKCRSFFPTPTDPPTVVTALHTLTRARLTTLLDATKGCVETSLCSDSKAFVRQAKSVSELNGAATFFDGLVRCVAAMQMTDQECETVWRQIQTTLLAIVDTTHTHRYCCPPVTTSIGRMVASFHTHCPNKEMAEWWLGRTDPLAAWLQDLASSPLPPSQQSSALTPSPRRSPRVAAVIDLESPAPTNEKTSQRTSSNHKRQRKSPANGHLPTPPTTRSRSGRSPHQPSPSPTQSMTDETTPVQTPSPLRPQPSALRQHDSQSSPGPVVMETEINQSEVTCHVIADAGMGLERMEVDRNEDECEISEERRNGDVSEVMQVEPQVPGPQQEETTQVEAQSGNEVSRENDAEMSDVIEEERVIASGEVEVVQSTPEECMPRPPATGATDTVTVSEETETTEGIETNEVPNANEGAETNEAVASIEAGDEITERHSPPPTTVREENSKKSVWASDGVRAPDSTPPSQRIVTATRPASILKWPGKPSRTPPSDRRVSFDLSINRHHTFEVPSDEPEPPSIAATGPPRPRSVKRSLSVAILGCSKRAKLALASLHPAVFHAPSNTQRHPRKSLSLNRQQTSPATASPPRDSSDDNAPLHPPLATNTQPLSSLLGALSRAGVGSFRGRQSRAMQQVLSAKGIDTVGQFCLLPVGKVRSMLPPGSLSPLLACLKAWHQTESPSKLERSAPSTAQPDIFSKDQPQEEQQDSSSQSDSPVVARDDNQPINAAELLPADRSEMDVAAEPQNENQSAEAEVTSLHTRNQSENSIAPVAPVHVPQGDAMEVDGDVTEVEVEDIEEGDERAESVSGGVGESMIGLGEEGVAVGEGEGVAQTESKKIGVVQGGGTEGEVSKDVWGDVVSHMEWVRGQVAVLGTDHLVGLQGLLVGLVADVGRELGGRVSLWGGGGQGESHDSSRTLS